MLFMQNNAPGHAVTNTKAFLNQLAIVVINWPPYSPDLNPIETLWKHMKKWLQEEYEECKFKNYDDLKFRVNRAWEVVVTPGLLRELIESMPSRMQAIIEADVNISVEVAENGFGGGDITLGLYLRKFFTITSRDLQLVQVTHVTSRAL